MRVPDAVVKLDSAHGTNTVAAIAFAFLDAGTDAEHLDAVITREIGAALASTCSFDDAREARSRHRLVLPLTGTVRTIIIARDVTADAFSAADRALASALADHAAIALIHADRLRAAHGEPARSSLRDGVSRVTRLDQARRATERARAAAVESAEAATRELESFSYSVAHDLRAPLRGIDAFSRFLVEDHGDKLDGEAMEHLAEIRANAHKMAELIDALLSLSRVTRSELRRVPTDLSTLARSVIAQLRQADPSRTVEVHIADSLIAECDPRLARSLVSNLVSNAWKFTAKRADARIEVGSTPGGGFFVRDNGAGFDMRYAASLFAPFQRMHAIDEFQGTGIGLATVQRIVHRHGGAISAQAVVGSGATFTFTLGPSARDVS